MTWRSISALLLLGLALNGCGHKTKQAYAYNPRGYYYKLLAFNTDTSFYNPNHVAWVSAVFKTQSDSTFWDSYNNLNDRFFIRMDSTTGNFIRHYVAYAAVADSACLLIRPADFFKQQFGSDSIPFFSRHDSVVKVELKLKQVLPPAEFNKLGCNLQQQEAEQVERFFGGAKELELAGDALGFYWVEKPAPLPLPAVEEGDQLLLAYKGYFLNGRLFEQAGSFEYVYGTPDQLVKGLNYVTGKLKLGQTAKILLPSRLAFGENGSSNGVVPPFTPLVYELKIIDVKKTK